MDRRGYPDPLPSRRAHPRVTNRRDRTAWMAVCVRSADVTETAAYRSGRLSVTPRRAFRASGATRTFPLAGGKGPPYAGDTLGQGGSCGESEAVRVHEPVGLEDAEAPAAVGVAYLDETRSFMHGGSRRRRSQVRQIVWVELLHLASREQCVHVAAGHLQGAAVAERLVLIDDGGARENRDKAVAKLCPMTASPLANTSLMTLEFARRTADMSRPELAEAQVSRSRRSARPSASVGCRTWLRPAGWRTR